MSHQNTAVVAESIPPANDNFLHAADALLRLVVDDAADQPLADEPTSYINDAEVWGALTEEIADLPIVLSTASGREAREWKTHPEARFGDLIKTVFSKHIVGKKDGNSIVTGSLGQSSKRRTKNNVLANYMMGLDVDSGASMEETFQKVRRANLTAIFYTTHSHGTTEVEIAYDKFHRWCVKEELPAEPTTDMIRRYMRDQTNYVIDVCDSAEFVEKRHEDGMKLIVKTRAIDKFRILFPLSAPYVYAQQVGAHKDVINAWESKVLGMGRSLSIEIDRVARDPSRLFYLPRHAKGADNWRILLTCGRLLRLEDIPSANPRDRVSNDPFDRAAHALGGSSGKSGNASLKQWERERAGGFDIASLFRDHCDDRIRETQTTDKLTVACPFDDDHSNPGDPDDKGCFVQSAGMDAEAFTFHCSHAGCADHKRLDMLAKAIELEWFAPDALWDDAYFDDPDGDAERQSGEAPGDVACVDLRGTGFKFDSADPDWIRVGRDRVCQPFEVAEHIEDAHGDNATLFLRFHSMGQFKTCKVHRADLWNRATVISQLAAMNFRIAGNGETTLELLRNLRPSLNGRWVNRRGWHGDAYLTIGGETIKQAGSAALTMRMLETTRKDFAPPGTLDGWKQAVAPVWEDHAAGREHLALAIMMGIAGPIFGRCHPEGFRMLSLHGPTSRGKSLASRLLASVSGPALSSGCYLNLRATSNGIEAMLPDLSGHAIALDEGQHIKAEHANELVFMMEAGAGKIAATQTRSAREVRRFGGLAMMANEKPWAQKLKDADVDVSPGFDARVLDINVAGVRDYPKGEATPLTTQLHGIKDHNGHVLPLVVRALLNIDPKTISGQIDRLTMALVGKDAKGLESRAMETLAWVWLGGITGKKLGVIPAGFSVGRVVRWARDNRVTDASRPVSERVLSSLRTAIARRRHGGDLYVWEKSSIPRRGGDELETNDIEGGHKNVAGYFYRSRGGEELIVLADAIRGMAGNVCSETEVAQYLRDAGFLRMQGKKQLFHDTLPMRDGTAERVKNYRIVSSFYLADSEADGDEPELSADAS
ncbi:DUF927 domain-containing protein [Mesorhizobium sp. M2D.F.Ca.ET.171.01.1.1]|uniref:DUF927 domain-containing protein n=1 Tax=unclassified Mesorhizobium TaxID=325217 RepID=UPI0010925FA1|nr:MULTISPECIES: DUF927 domain-containing protein [unclassified Mesorhizobium]TGS97474.1 DUF927 domain-containing protein [Mesorhizobium sp. M2D.F.Ca.ET.178.01.1.1]TGT12045.1 DUF927 domain-containing protein [Mesorhizobium sp. M2D.F.Ca.ET.171.01.1.1]